MKKEAPQNIEQDRELTLTLSKKAQEGVFNALKMSLQAMTNTETGGHYQNQPEIIEELDEVRKVATTIVRNLRKKVDPMEALYLGLTDLIHPQQLQSWAKMPIRDNWDVPVRQKSQYFLEKAANKQRAQNSKSTE